MTQMMLKVLILILKLLLAHNSYNSNFLA